MPLLLGTNPTLEEVVAELQAWAAQIDGVNAAERLNQLTDSLGTSSVRTGMGAIWFTSTPPTGYLLCDGSSVSRTQYANLFALWGVTFGSGDGATTFTLPDLRRRFPMGKSSSDTLGGTGGAFDHTHTMSGSTGSEAAHTHTIASGATGNPSAFTGITLGTDADVAAYPHTHGGGTLTTSAGSSHSHSVGTLATAAANPPYFVVHYIVKT